MIRHPRWPLVVAGAMWTACSGTISGDLGMEPTAGRGGADPTRPGTGPGPIPPEMQKPGEMRPAACVSAPKVVAGPTRRLSDAEYAATARDLIPGSTVKRDFFGASLDAGFENNTSRLGVDSLRVTKYGDAAASLAAKAAADLPMSVVPCPATQDTCGAQFVDSFGAKAFRRPLTDEEKTVYGNLFAKEKAAAGFASAVHATVEAMLQAPEFLYRFEFGEGAAMAGAVRLSPHEVAARLSYLVWGSMPDLTLSQAARDKKLGTAEEMETQARRMLKDVRARDMLQDFHRQWLGFDHLDAEIKDTRLFPQALRDAVKEESNRFVSMVMWDGDGTLKSLLTSAQSEVSKTLAGHYGVSPPARDWDKVLLPPSERAGVLTRAHYLAAHSHIVSMPPVLRAAPIMMQLLCAVVPDPPADVDTNVEPPKPGDPPRTNRQTFEAQLEREPRCKACHAWMDPIGTLFENYDANGKYRTEETVGSQRLPVDSRVQVPDIFGDVAGWSSNALEFSRKLGDSQTVRTCSAAQWYEFAWGAAAGGADECLLASMRGRLEAAGGDIREMLITLARAPELRQRPAVMP